MKRTTRIIIYSILVLIILVLCGIFLCNIDMVVLSPKGWIGLQQRNLFFFACLVMLIVIIPVFLLTFFITLRYRADNKKAKYTPNWGHNTLAEIIWWGIPFIIIIVLGTVNWIACFKLDPYKAIASEKKTIRIQVVALQWKWLFIYPDEGFAVMNYIRFPKDTPIHFEITADAPMNSFWIPELGGQIFAMPGMRTELNLIANANGKFRGVSANLSGDGFAGMRFIAEATSEQDYQKWLNKARSAKKTLNKKEFMKLNQPSKNNPVKYFSLKDPKLFDWVVTKDSMPHAVQ